jgi:hypothetical protein
MNHGVLRKGGGAHEVEDRLGGCSSSSSRSSNTMSMQHT